MEPARGNPHESSAPRSPEAILHDLRNLLTTIAALTVRARGALEGNDGPAAREAKQVITQLGDTVGNAMILARSSGRPPAVDDEVPFAEYVIEHAPALGAMVGGDDHFSLHVADGLAGTSVRMGATALLRVLVNVLRNAQEASRDGVNIEMELDVFESGEPLEVRPHALPPRRYAVVRVLDRGDGVDDGVDDGLVDVLIEPGVSAKGAGRGRGLSLVAQLLAEASGGLRVNPRVGGGSTIELFVPTGP